MSIVVFDIGGSAVKFGLWQEDALSGKGYFETPKTWNELKAEMKSVFDGYAASVSVDGVAISSPGAVDSGAGIIGGISAVQYIHHFSIRTEWEMLFGVPVSVENDANCAALAEVWLGAARDVQNALFIVIGSGIGGAVIVNRQLFKGKNLFGGEFGYMLLDGENTLSRLGSPVQVAERYGKAMEMPDGVVDGKYLFERAEECEPVAVAYVDGMIDALARGIYNLSVSFNPDRVIIGGGVSVREDLIARIRERTAYHLKAHGAESVDPDIQVCTFRNDANLIGAVAHFRQTEGL
ncbi:ROK family protein [Trichococcus paludicola]|uniref:ROK family protein n=1 Tax=Trichococcus paludicola TaxID=2052942 RepID=UPI000D37059F|nr:ROK family protein [Trichococcus paludicola]